MGLRKRLNDYVMNNWKGGLFLTKNVSDIARDAYNAVKQKKLELTMAAAIATAPIVGGGCPGGDSPGGSSNTKSYFTSAEGETNVKAGTVINKVLTGADNEGDSFTFGLVTDAPYLTLNSNTLEGQPQASDIGNTYTVQVSIDDGISGPNYQTWQETIAKADDPVITTTGPTDSTEGILYYYDADVTDPAGHTVTWTHGAGTVSGAAINSSTGETTWTPGVPQERQVNTLEVTASNAFGGSTTETINTTTKGREDITFHVEDCPTGFIDIAGATVSIAGTYTNVTDAFGDCTIYNVPDGEHSLSVTCAGVIHPSTWGIEVGEIFPTSFTYEIMPSSFDMDNFDYYYRRYDETGIDLGPGNGKTQRPTYTAAASWKANICKDDELGSGTPITSGDIDDMKDTPLNHLPAMSRNKLNFTFVEDISTNLDAPGTVKTSYGFWNNSIPDGGHAEYLTGNEITANRIVINTPMPLKVYRHEWYQAFGARGEETIPYPSPPNNNTITPSILQGEDSYTTWDINAMYYNFSIPIGTTSPDNRPGNITDTMD